ncbi:MAG: hypothetical protein QXV32_06805 [Conexivisphaerales archaeon]
MEKANLYLLTLSFLIVASVVSMASLGQNSLDVYVSLFVISYFATSAIFSPRRVTFDFLGLALFIIFAVIVALRVLAILGLSL